MQNKSFINTLLIIAFVGISVIAIYQRGEPEVVSTNLENIPDEILGFKSTEDYFSQEVYDELNADKHVFRHYQSANGKKIDLYIGYYGTKKGGRTPHNPYACLPGAGWAIKESRKAKLYVDYYNKSVQVNYILAQRGNLYESVLHWYQSDKTKVLDSGIKQNVQRFLGRVLYNRNDGAFVRVSVVSSEKDIDEANELIQMFSKKILSLLPKYWPLEE